MALRVAVDFGTSSTCIAVSAHGREPQLVAVDGRPLLSSAVYAAPDGTLFVGQEAERQAAVDPSRFEPNPKRRIDETELLLGNTVVAVRDVIRAVLGRAIDEVRRMAGGASVDQLVLTHPADWGGTRARVLRQAANGLADRIVLVPEPVAAAVFYATSFVGARTAGGETLAVLDIGGGTVDVSVVRRRSGPASGSPQTGQGFHVLATRGDPAFGGADVDQALLRHVGSLVSGAAPEAWRELTEGRELADRRRRRVVWQDVCGAKETLSRHAYTDVAMPPPFPDAHVTRADLEALIVGPLERTVELTAATVREAGLTPAELTAIFLVGGSSRIPMVARLLHERTGVVPSTLDQPETVVARGALVATTPSTADLGAPAEDITDMDVTRPAVARPRPAPVRRPIHHTGPVPTAPATPMAPVHASGHAAPVPSWTPASGVPGPMPPGPGFSVAPPGGPPSPPSPMGRGRKRWPWWLAGGGVVVAAMIAVVVGIVTGGDQEPTDQGRLLAQYDYRFTMPSDWSQVGGDATQREAQIAPNGAGSQENKITVQENVLNYDSDADPGRAISELRAKYERAGANFSDLNEKASFADRNVVYYRQRTSNGTVDWYVLFKGSMQVSVGCQYTEAGRSLVYGACDQVVRTMTIG